MEARQKETGLGGSAFSSAWGAVARVALGAAAAATSLGCALRIFAPILRAAVDLARLPAAESVRFLTVLLAGG